MITVICCLLVQNEGKFDLSFRGQVGLVSEYKIGMKGEVEGERFEAEAVVRQKTLSLGKDGGYRLETVSKGSVMRVGSQEYRDERESKGVLVFGRGGKLEKFEGKEEDSFRLARMTRFVAPGGKVGIGEKWKVTYGKSGSMPELTMEFQLSEVVNGTGNVRFEGNEGGEGGWKGKGGFLVDLVSGMTVETRAEIVNWMSAGKTGSYFSRIVKEKSAI